MLVGDPAKRQAVTNPTRTVYSIKRFMGRRHNEVQAEEKMVPYEVVGGPEDYVKVKIGDKEYTPPEISAQDPPQAEGSRRELPGPQGEQGRHHGAGVLQRRPAPGHRKTPARSPGWKSLRIINEPTAAALAYGLDKKKDEKIVVFDLGGGTFDVSVLDVGDGVFEVISTNGDTHLGGDDFDEVLINYVADEFKKEQGHRPAQGPDGPAAAEGSVREGQEGASFADADRHQPAVHHGRRSGPKHLQMTITPRQVRAAGRSTWSNAAAARCCKALEDAKLKPSEIDEVVLVGGSTRMPKVQQIVKEMFGKEPHKGVNPGRSRGRRRGDSGRRAGRRSEGRAAARRDAAVAGHRNPGRRDDGARRAQHDDPDRARRKSSARPTTTRRP